MELLQTSKDGISKSVKRKPKGLETARQGALAILQKHPEGISPLEAAQKHGCFKFTTYISDLRRLGHDIEKVYEGRPGHYHYRLRRLAKTDKAVDRG